MTWTPQDQIVSHGNLMVAHDDYRALGQGGADQHDQHDQHSSSSSSTVRHVNHLWLGGAGAGLGEGHHSYEYHEALADQNIAAAVVNVAEARAAVRASSNIDDTIDDSVDDFASTASGETHYASQNDPRSATVRQLSGMTLEQRERYISDNFLVTGTYKTPTTRHTGRPTPGSWGRRKKQSRPAEVATEADECGICHEPYRRHDSVSVSKTCGHVFHRDCLLKWLCGEPSDQCPICRRDIVTLEYMNGSCGTGLAVSGSSPASVAENQNNVDPRVDIPIAGRADNQASRPQRSRPLIMRAGRAFQRTFIPSRRERRSQQPEIHFDPPSRRERRRQQPEIHFDPRAERSNATSTVPAPDSRCVQDDGVAKSHCPSSPSADLGSSGLPPLAPVSAEFSSKSGSDGADDSTSFPDEENDTGIRSRQSGCGGRSSSCSDSSVYFTATDLSARPSDVASTGIRGSRGPQDHLKNREIRVSPSEGLPGSTLVTSSFGGRSYPSSRASTTTAPYNNSNIKDPSGRQSSRDLGPSPSERRTIRDNSRTSNSTVVPDAHGHIDVVSSGERGATGRGYTCAPRDHGHRCIDPVPVRYPTGSSCAANARPRESRSLAGSSSSASSRAHVDSMREEFIERVFSRKSDISLRHGNISERIKPSSFSDRTEPSSFTDTQGRVVNRSAVDGVFTQPAGGYASGAGAHHDGASVWPGTTSFATAVSGMERRSFEDDDASEGSGETQFYEIESLFGSDTNEGGFFFPGNHESEDPARVPGNANDFDFLRQELLPQLEPIDLAVIDDIDEDEQFVQIQDHFLENMDEDFWSDARRRWREKLEDIHKEFEYPDSMRMYPWLRPSDEALELIEARVEDKIDEFLHAEFLCRFGQVPSRGLGSVPSRGLGS